MTNVVLPAWLTRIELLAVVVLTPLLLFPSGHRRWAAVAIPALWLVRLGMRQPIWTGRPSDAAIGLLAATAAMSAWFAFDRAAAVPKLCGLLLGLAWFGALVHWADRANRLAALWAAYLAAGVALAVAVVFGTAWIDKWPWIQSVAGAIPRLIRGVPGAEFGFHPNAGAGALLLFAPAAVLLACDRRLSARWRAAATAAAVPLVLAVVLTQSRGAAFGVVFGGAATAALLSPRHRKWIALAVAVAFTAAILALPAILEPPNADAATAQRRILVSSRIELWLRSADLILAHPWTGVGFNGLRTVIQAEQPLFLIEPNDDPVHAHNQLLQTGADLGLVGLGAYIAIWLVTLGALARAARRSGEWWHGAAKALLFAFLCHLGFGAADAIPLGAKVGITFWWALAVAAATDRLARAEEPAQPRLPRSAIS